MLSLADGKKLLQLARKSIEMNFSGGKPDISSAKDLDEDRGVFVTLHKDGRLRGCIGFPYPVMPLKVAVVDGARAAAFEDPRFEQVVKDEVDGLDIEISVLTVPEEITCPRSDVVDEIKIGSDGLIIKGPLGSGLLLPQVFTEYKCDSLRALEMVCEKAGLPADAWKDDSNKLFKFQAQIFRE